MDYYVWNTTSGEITSAGSQSGGTPDYDVMTEDWDEGIADPVTQHVVAGVLVDRDVVPGTDTSVAIAADGEYHEVVNEIPTGSIVTVGGKRIEFTADLPLDVSSTIDTSVYIQVEPPLPLGPSGFLLQAGAGGESPRVRVKDDVKVRLLPPFEVHIDPDISVGDIKKWAGEPPPGWFWLDGATYNRADYPALFEALTISCTGDVTASNAVLTSVSKDFSEASPILAGGGRVEVALVFNGTIQFTREIASCTATTITMTAAAPATSLTGAFLRIIPFDHWSGSGTTFTLMTGSSEVIFAGVQVPPQPIRFA